QEEYSALINSLESNVVETPVSKVNTSSTFGASEILVATRRGAYTSTFSNQVVTSTIVEPVVSAKTLTTSSYIAEPVEVSNNIV
uniref:hypothetical protein n=1 Tax=Klebsiella pneumoniae TaxID=573 RepID=UPI00259FFBB0